MIPIHYSGTDRPMKVGDKVFIKRRFLPAIKCEVSYVYDPGKDSVLKGDNEYGFTLKLPNGKYRWYGCMPSGHIVVIDD